MINLSSSFIWHLLMQKRVLKIYFLYNYYHNKIIFVLIFITHTIICFSNKTFLTHVWTHIKKIKGATLTQHLLFSEHFNEFLSSSYKHKINYYISWCHSWMNLNCQIFFLLFSTHLIIWFKIKFIVLRETFFFVLVSYHHIIIEINDELCKSQVQKREKYNIILMN